MEMSNQEASHKQRSRIMGAILPPALAGAFDPNDIQALSLAYEDICDALHINGDIRARETIAERVIELARRGERCPTVLRDRVLTEANGGTGANAAWRRRQGRETARPA
jgi:hypothetical protein